MTLERLRWSASDCLVVAVRNLRHFTRQPQLLLFSTIQPIMFVVLFSYVFGGSVGRSLPRGVEYEEFNAIAGDPSDGDLWGVGWESPGLGYFQMAQRYDGTSWQRTDPPDFPNNNNLYGVAVAGSSAWAVGYGSPSGRLGPLIERWNSQAWVIEENPGDIGTLYAITRIGRTLWAVGDETVMVRTLGGASD